MKNTVSLVLLFAIIGLANRLHAQNSIMCITANIPVPVSFDTVTRAALADDYYLWDNGKTLVVKFLNGSARLQEKTKKTAKLWEQAANIRFEFVTQGPAHIRIEFTNKGFIQSTLGTLAMSYPQDKPSASIDTTAFNNHQLMQGMVLHLFGHILGLQDEVYVPQNGNNWNEQALNSYSARIQLPNTTVKETLVQKYWINQVNWLKYDGRSIMVSPIIKTLLGNNYPSYWNSNISTKDKALIGLYYPTNETRYDSAVKPAINFAGLKMVKSSFKKGISFFPCFDFVSKGNGIVCFLLLLTDKEGKAIPAYSMDYNVLNQVGTFIQPNIVGYSISAINKNNLHDMELFIPNSIFYNIKKEDGIYAVFKVFYRNPKEDTSKWLYVSKPYEIK